MHTPTSPASHTAILFPTDPAPAYWPTLTNATQPAPRHWLLDAPGLAAPAADDGARAAADLRRVRRMVAELVAIEGVRA